MQQTGSRKRPPLRRFSTNYRDFWGVSRWDGPEQLAANRLIGLVAVTLLIQPTTLWVAFTDGMAVVGPMLMVGIPATISYLFVLFALRWGIRPWILGHVFAMAITAQVTIGYWQLGGLLSGAAGFALVIPVAATLVSGPLAGWLWLAIQVVMWFSWVNLADVPSTIDALTLTIPTWERGLAFVMTVVGGFFQAGVTVLYRVEVGHRRELAKTLSELEDRVADRTAELQREVVERREAEARALRANRAKTTFLANMSHELRTPVTTVIGYTELVGEELAEGERVDPDKDLEPVLQAARHLLTLIDSMLDLARVESGTIDLTPTDILASDVIVPIAEMMQPHLARRHNVLEVLLDDGCSLHADPERTKQIVLNLLSNANKFTDQGHIRITASEGANMSQIEVSDTGRGIPTDQLDAIFERFVQGHDRRVNHPGGTGLGLTISRQLAAQMGGSLRAESTVGRGSTFILELPRSPRESTSV